MYLLLDGVSLRVKTAGGVKRRQVLCAYRIAGSGERRLLDFRLARRESQASWEAFLTLRNVANLLKRSQQEACLRGARAISEATTQQGAIQAFRAWAQRWQGEAARAVACVERDLEELLAHFRCPVAHRKNVRTTNVSERCFREVRRRTRPMSCFTNDASCERGIYAVLAHLNHKWKGTALPEFTHKT